MLSFILRITAFGFHSLFVRPTSSLRQILLVLTRHRAEGQAGLPVPLSPLCLPALVLHVDKVQPLPCATSGGWQFAWLAWPYHGWLSSASQAQDGTEVTVKEVLAGDSVHSLLSILDVITVSISSPLVCPHSLDGRSLGAPASSPVTGGSP